jgi:hypothetical protein
MSSESSPRIVVGTDGLNKYTRSYLTQSIPLSPHFQRAKNKSL